MSEHTSGPWHTDDNNHELVRARGMSVEPVICFMGNDFTDARVRVANARLIAAAPELLAACEAQKKLTDALEKMLISYRMGKQPTERTFRIIDKKEEILMQADAAIAKAKGPDDA